MDFYLNNIKIINIKMIDFKDLKLGKKILNSFHLISYSYNSQLWKVYLLTTTGFQIMWLVSAAVPKVDAEAFYGALGDAQAVYDSANPYRSN